MIFAYVAGNVKISDYLQINYVAGSSDPAQAMLLVNNTAFVDEIASEVSPAFHFCYRHKNLLLFQL